MTVATVDRDAALAVVLALIASIPTKQARSVARKHLNNICTKCQRRAVRGGRCHVHRKAHREEERIGMRRRRARTS